MFRSVVGLGDTECSYVLICYFQLFVAIANDCAFRSVLYDV